MGACWVDETMPDSCDYKVRFLLESRPEKTMKYSCKEHLAEMVQTLLDESMLGSVVVSRFQ